MSDEKPARRTVVEGGDLKQRFEAERIVIREWVEEAIEPIQDDIKALRTQMDEVITAHRNSPVKRTFDIVEKMASPMTGALLLGNMLVVLIWLTGLPSFEGFGYKIGARATAANIDSDVGEDPPGTTRMEP